MTLESNRMGFSRYLPLWILVILDVHCQIVQSQTGMRLDLMPKEKETSLFTGYEFLVKCSFVGSNGGGGGGGVPARWITPSGQRVLADNSARVSVERDNSALLLLISSVMLEDNGEWKCESDAPPLSTSVKLIILPKPMIEADSVSYGQLGHSHFLSCKVEPSDNITIYWRRGNGGRIRPEEDSDFEILPTGLRIRSLKLSDNETFYCVADRAQLGVYVEHPINVVVSEPVSFPHITCANTPCAVFGQNALLRCHAKGSPPPEYEWSKDKNLIVKSTDEFKYVVEDDSLLLTNLNEDDTGIYTCRVFNGFDKRGQSVDFRIDVVAPPVVYPMQSITVTQDDQIAGIHGYPQKIYEFVCKVSSNASSGVTIRWMYGPNHTLVNTMPRDHYRIIDSIGSNVSTLQILRPSRDTFGTYTCEASNMAGRATANVDLLVEFGPILHESIPLHIYAVDGYPTNVTCTFDGYPLNGISWSDHSGQFLMDGIKSSSGFAVIGIRDIYYGYYTISSTMTIVTRLLNNSQASPLVVVCDAGRNSATQISIRHAGRPGFVSVSQSPMIFPDMIIFNVSLSPDLNHTGGIMADFIVSNYKSVYNESTLLMPPYETHLVDLEQERESGINIEHSVRLKDLKPSTLYRLSVFARSKAGDGDSIHYLFKTSPKTHPRYVIFEPTRSDLKTAPLIPVNESSKDHVYQCHSFDSCVINWEILSNGGDKLTSVVITYNRITKTTNRREGKIHVLNERPHIQGRSIIHNLQPFSIYRVRLKISNAAGLFLEKEFTVATSTAPAGYKPMVRRARKSMTALSIIGIMLSILIAVCLIFLGLTCLMRPSGGRSTKWCHKGKRGTTRNLLGQDGPCGNVLDGIHDHHDDLSSKSTFLTGDQRLDRRRRDYHGGSFTEGDIDNLNEEHALKDANINPLYNTNSFTITRTPWNVFPSSPRSSGHDGGNRRLKKNTTQV
ncbi:hypothetical protein ACOME3_010125 [Neoechinorhynchus agilis]